eukprot:4056227-Amphidinium_carterae.2
MIASEAHPGALSKACRTAYEARWLSWPGFLMLCFVALQEPRMDFGCCVLSDSIMVGGGQHGEVEDCAARRRSDGCCPRQSFSGAQMSGERVVQTSPRFFNAGIDRTPWDLPRDERE